MVNGFVIHVEVKNMMRLKKLFQINLLILITLIVLNNTCNAYIINFLETSSNYISNTYKGFTWSDTKLNSYKELDISDGTLDISRTDTFRYKSTFFDGDIGTEIKVIGMLDREVVLTDDFILKCGFNIYKTDVTLDTIKFVSNSNFYLRQFEYEDVSNCNGFMCSCTNSGNYNFTNYPNTFPNGCPPPIINPKTNPPPIAPVPEPSPLILLGFGIITFIAASTIRRKRGLS